MKKYVMSLVGWLFLLSISAVASAEPVNNVYEGICPEDGVNINCAYRVCIQEATASADCGSDVVVDVDLLDSTTHSVDPPGENRTSVLCAAACGPDEETE